MDDPLGALNAGPDPIELSSVTVWQEDTCPPVPKRDDPKGVTTASGSEGNYNDLRREGDTKVIVSPFPFEESLNRKIGLWMGDLTALQVDSIINSTNESLTDRAGVCADIFRIGGHELAKEVSLLEGCRTGESKATSAPNMPAKHVIHTVGPRYNVKYETAAENALHSCYRSCMQNAAELKARTIAFPVINSPHRGYPRVEGAHVAARTIRRFLERFGHSFDFLVLCVDRESDLEIYRTVVPLYFPRSEEEATAAVAYLPRDVGNEFGERVIEERKIRIGMLPGLGDGSEALPVESEDERPKGVEEYVSDSAAVAAFGSTALTNPDDQRGRVPAGEKDAEAASTDRRYARLLTKAKASDLSDMAKRGLLFTAGTDNRNRTVFVFVGRNFPYVEKARDFERMLMYTVRTLEANHALTRDFVVVYCHATVRSEQVPDLRQLKLIYAMWERKFLKHMQRCYIVHPSFLFKMTLTLLRPWTNDMFTERITYLTRLADLFSIIPHEQIRLPDPIYQYDYAENGTPYTPAEDKANEGL